MSKICIGYNDITKEYIYIDNNTGITSTSKEWLNVPYEPDNNVERFVLDMSISELKQQLALTEKALELACQTLRHSYEQDDIKRICQNYIDLKDIVNFKPNTDILEYFKTKAKEMMKSE